MATQSTIRPGRRFSGSGSATQLNFSQTKGSQVTITAAEAKPATVVSVTITTQGNPVQIIVSGDANPSSAGTWGLLNIYRDAVAIGQNVQFESSAANENVPYSLQVVDEPAAGTWTYSLKVVSVTANTQFGENAGPIITVTELGGVGTAAPSGVASGDLGGTYPGPDVVALQGYSISTTAPGAGEALVWDGSNWVPTAISAGAGGNDTNIQYNSGGSLAGTNNFIFDDTSTRVTLTDGSQALDVYPNLIEYVGAGSLQIEAGTTVDVGTLTATGVNLGSSTAATTIAGAFTLPTTDGASGEVLTTDGSGNVSWQAGGGGSGAAGAANEIQYNDGSNALTASSGLTFDGTTLAVNSIGPSAFTVSSTIDGQFLDVNTNLYQLTLLDPTQLPLNVNATLGPSDLAIFDDNVSQSGNVQAGLVGVFDNTTTNNLKMIIPAGVATIKSEDALSAAQALNLSIAELQINTDPGTSGYVLTSNGAGAAPTWQAAAGGSTVGNITTNDSVPTSVLSLTPDANTTVVYKATIAARKQGSNNGASYGLVGAFKENGGTVTQIGTTTSLWSFEDTVALDAQLVITGSDVEVQVTGEATTYPGGVTYIDPVSPPAPSGTTWTVGTLGGEDFADIATALADASVVNGDKLLLSAQTFTVASTITVSKEVTIQGAGLPSTIIQTANTAGDPVTVIDITTNNVTIRDLTVKQRKTTNTSIEVAISINPATPIGSSGHYLEAVRVETMEFGVYVRSDGWQINNCQLAYVGANNTTRRLIGIYRSNGQGIIANTTYDSAEGGVITGATRVITVISTVGTPSERFGGYFRVTNVTPVVSSTVSQFFNCESFPVGGDPLEFVVDNCTSSESSAFIVFFVDRTNLLSGFSYIALTDNTISGNHGGSPIGTKGLFAVDGTGAGANSMGTTTFYVNGNNIGNTTFRTGWSTILNTGLGYTASQLAQAGFDGVYYTNPSLSISTATVNSWDWTASVETVSAP